MIQSACTKIKDLVTVLKTCKEYNMVTTWMCMKEICTKHSGNDDKEHLSCQEEVGTGYTERTASDLRPKGQYPYKSFLSGGHFGGEHSRQENSTN